MFQDLAGVLADAAAEAEALNYLASLPLARDAFLSAALYLPELAPAAVYAPVWRGKAAVARVLAQRRRDRRHDHPRLRPLADELQQVRRQLARLLLAPA